MKQKILEPSDWKLIFLSFLSLTIILSLVLGIIWIIVQAIFSPSPAVAMTITVGAGAFGSIIVLVWTKHWERRREIEQDLREKKIPIYKDFMDFWFKTLGIIMIERRQLNEQDLEDVNRFFVTFTPKIITWGSDKVLEKYSSFRRKYSSQSAQQRDRDPKILSDFEELMYVIRLDLGHKNENLKSRDLLALFISDIDKLPQK